MREPVLSRRRHPRAAATFAGALLEGRHAWPCAVEGLSEGGARLRGVVACAGEHIVVELVLPAGRVQTEADVVRVDPDGLGVAFPDLLPHARSAVRAAVDACPEEPGARPAVLVVDGAPDSGRRLAGELRALGCVSSLAASAVEALARLEDRDRDVELALIHRSLDVDGIDGFDLAAFLAAEYPQVRCVLVNDVVSANELRAALDGRA